ncbi:MAG TPA: nitroreductase family protein [Candidatus Binatia bacterium]|nr:nitroreductase family protein [Candidatus Binatia bacterium]
MSLTPDELLTTTRAVRKRLDFARPVPRELLQECLDVAVQAPTGSNRQDWQFLLVSDPARKQAIAERYGRAYDAYRQRPAPEYAPGDVRGERRERVVDSSRYLREHMHEAPWLVIPCVRGRLDRDVPVERQASVWGSIIPAFWSFMLAARARGLGTTLTTLHLAYEQEVAEILGIPYEDYTQAGMTPVAFYTGEGFRPGVRVPLEDVVHWESW